MTDFSQMEFSNALSRINMYDYNFTEVYSQGSNWQYFSIGLDNGLALNSRQAIIWTNDDLFYQRIYASPGLNELIDKILKIGKK